MTLEGCNDDEVVISGISGTFPASSNIKELIYNLINGVEMTTDDHHKFDGDSLGMPVRLGCMPKLEKCDIQFFGLNRKLGNASDPVMRRFLENTLEAIFDAGLSPSDLKGSKTNVIFSTSILETEINVAHGLTQENYAIMGRSRALHANRVSYWLDLKGSSYAIDCGWGGGMEGLAQATESIKKGTCTAAIIGSGNTILTPYISYHYANLDLLSDDGFTRCFDAEANGCGRSETICCMILQKAKDAKRSYGTVVHALTLCMRIPRNITDTHSENWERLLQQFYEECKVDPSKVYYLEAFGAANKDRDAMELNAAGNMFCINRSQGNPLLIGSVKSNLGNTEASSHLTGLIKLAIALNTGVIPANKHFKTPNPSVPYLVNGAMKVVTENVPVEGEYFAMNSYSLGSVYGHVLLRRHPVGKITQTFEEGKMPWLLMLSGRTEETMDTIFEDLRILPYDPEAYSLINNSFRKFIPGYMNRGYIIVPEEQKIQEFKSFTDEGKKPIWFVVSGMGSQWTTMGRDLMDLPIFRKSIQKSHNLLKQFDLDLIHILTYDDPEIFENILHSFVGIVAVQIGLVDIIRAIGVEPDGIIGHSVGETVASYCDGCTTHEQTIMLAYYRGKGSLDGDIIDGKMAAVGLGYQQLKNRIPDGIDIGCHNASDSSTITGPAALVDEYCETLKSQGVFAKVVNSGGIPFHSRYIRHLGPTFKGNLQNVITKPNKRTSRWISTSVAEELWGEDIALYGSADYQVNNLSNPVLFEEGCKYIPENAIVIEIAPHGLLQAILRRSLKTCTNIPMTNKNTKNQKIALLQAIGRMYLNGISVNMAGLYEPVTYPVSRGTPELSHLATWEHSYDCAVEQDFKEKALSNRKMNLRAEFPAFVLSGLQIDGVPTIPQATYLLLVWKVLVESQDMKSGVFPVIFKDLIFHQEFLYEAEKDLEVWVYLLTGSGDFEVVKDDIVLLSGQIQMKEEPTAELESMIIEGQQLVSDEFYGDLERVGYTYNTGFKSVTNVTIGEKGLEALMEHENNWVYYLTSLFQLRILMESQSTNKILKIQKILQLTLDPPLNGRKGTVQMDFETNKLNSKQVLMEDVFFTASARRPVRFTNEELNTPIVDLPTSNNSSNQITFIQYEGKSLEGRQLAFSGVSQDGGKIMGLAVAEENSLIIKEDPILNWKVPSSWSLGQVITVPLHFTMAYNALHIYGDIKPGRKTVITAGFNKLGLACLRVALDVTTDVYTLVSSDEEKESLTRLLPKLPVTNVTIVNKSSPEHLAMYLKKVFPSGVDLLVNTGNPENVRTLLGCVRNFGAFVEMSDEVFHSRGRLENTSVFLASISLFTNGGNTIVNSPDHSKKVLHSLIEDGIAKGIVAPLFEPLPKDLLTTHTLQLDHASKLEGGERFSCQTDRAYLILGGEPDLWLSIAEWFISRNAKYIIAVHQEKNLTNPQLNRIKALQTKATLVIKPSPSLNPRLINHIFEVSRFKIALTMLLPYNLNADVDESELTALCQQDTFLVAVLQPTTRLLSCTELKTREKPTLTVLWEEPMNGRTERFLQTFDRLLNMETKDVIQIKGEQKDDKIEEDYFRGLLPKSTEELIKATEDLPRELEVTEMMTEGLPYQEVREIYPIFLIPGVDGRSELLTKFRKSNHPVFVIDCLSVNTLSMEEFAMSVRRKLLSICKSPYILIGDGWGGAVAMAIAKLSESLGEETQVFLLQATPDDLEKYQYNDMQQLENTLLSRFFNYDLNNSESLQWNQRLNECLSHLPSDQKVSVSRGINSIRSKLQILRLSDDKNGIMGPIHCITRCQIRRSNIEWLSENLSLTVIEPTQDILSEENLQVLLNNVLEKAHRKKEIVKH